MRRGSRIIGVAMVGALGVTLAACGSSSTSASSTSSTPSATTTSMVKPDFGPACSAVPKSGPGSFGGMTTAPVATAASNNPVLSTLVSAVKAAGLVNTLNAAPALTVFAPDNAAFAKVPSATLNSLLANKAALTKVLEYHVVAGRISPAHLAGMHKTLEGATLTVTGHGTNFTVNGTAHVVCGDVLTANATVYIINGVLTPPSQ